MPIRNNSVTFIVNCGRGGSSQIRWMHENPGLFGLWPGSSLCLYQGKTTTEMPWSNTSVKEGTVSSTLTDSSSLWSHWPFQCVMDSDSASIWVQLDAFIYLLTKPRGIPASQICFHHKNTKKWATITQLCSRGNSRHCSELRGGNSKGNGETARGLAG